MNSGQDDTAHVCPYPQALRRTVAFAFTAEWSTAPVMNQKWRQILRGVDETSMVEDCWLELDKKLSALLTKSGDAAARSMIEQLQETEASWVVLKRIEGLMTGRFSFDKDVSAALNPSYGLNFK